MQEDLKQKEFTKVCEVCCVTLHQSSLFKRSIVQNAKRRREDHDTNDLDESASSTATSTPVQNRSKRMTGIARPFPCFHCDKTFREKWDRRIHIQTAHMMQKFACPEDACDDKLTVKLSLKRHLKRAHRMTSDEARQAAAEVTPTYEHPDMKN
jgi:hypothetical protein